MTAYYPAVDVAIAINAMPDYPKAGERKLVVSWFIRIPGDERVEYSRLVEKYLRNMSKYDVATRKIEFLGRVLRENKITGFRFTTIADFEDTPMAKPLKVSEYDTRVLGAIIRMHWMA